MTNGVNELKRVVLKHALLNSIRHNGRPNVNAVLGKVLAEKPELRSDIPRVLSLVKSVCKEVDSMSVDKQKSLLEELFPGLLAGGGVREGKRGLPELPGAREGMVVTRFAPNPDSVLHLGSARAAILSHDYARMYKGVFILRFDDTDPRTKRPRMEFYEYVREDLEWLGCRWDKEFRQSERLETYYEYATKLIKLGGAYVCRCRPEGFRSYVSESRACPHRDLPVEEQLEEWGRMLNGFYGEGEVVLRVKTDLAHPNPAVRDWPAFRIIDTERNPHPIVGSKYVVWPLYNWASAIDDKLMSITHVLRAQEHTTNTIKQKYVYSYFGWEYPVTIHYGRLKVEGSVLSKSAIEGGVRRGLYRGYDDPRLATLRALRRRGVLPEAIRQVIHQVGLKSSDASISIDNLMAINKKLVDPIAPRYFSVLGDIAKLVLEGVNKPLVATMPKHPQDQGMGKRSYTLNPRGGRVSVYIQGSDARRLEEGSLVRLMGLANVRVRRINGEVVTCALEGGGAREARERGAYFIHWVSPDHSTPVVVVMDDGGEVEGLAERLLAEEPVGKIVQLERLFFARMDRVINDTLILYYSTR